MSLALGGPQQPAFITSTRALSKTQNRKQRLINDKAGHLQTGLGLQKGHRWLLIRLSLGGRWGLVEAVPSEPNPPRPFTSGGLKLSRAASPRARALLVQSMELAAPNDPRD